MLLRHDRVVIASTVLSARLRTARRTGRDLNDVFAHQQAAMPEQLLLFGHEEQPARKKAGPVDVVDVAAPRTDLEALELTADQLSRIGRTGQRLAALRKDGNQRAHQAAAGSTPSAQDAPAAAPGNQQPGPGHGQSRGPGQRL